MNDFTLLDISLDMAEIAARDAADRGLHTLIGALILRPDGRLFAQRRSLTRNFGAGLWDNVGGHLEVGETLSQALSREIHEETGWHLGHILRVIACRTWSDPRGESLEYIVIATATGDLDHPQLEGEKVDQTAWIDAGNLDLLKENRQGDTSQFAIYAHALKVLHEQPPSR
jgi:8-oxo-dGTP pyrophosphatase MutT (NUDIX family)